MTNWLAKLTDLPEGHEGIRTDFDKRYTNTYMVDVVDNKPRIVFFIGCDANSYHFRDVLTDNTTIYTKQSDVNITPFLPGVGYYNVQGIPMYLYKVPQKQWKRSFCTSIYVTPTLPGRYNTDPRWKALAVEALHPSYAHLDEISKKIFSFVAVSKKFAIQQDEQSNINLLYRQYVVGRLDFNLRTITVVQPIFLQEIQDLLKYTGVQTWNLK